MSVYFQGWGAFFLGWGVDGVNLPPPPAAIAAAGGTSRKLPDRRALSILGEDRLVLELLTVFLECIDE